MLNCFKIKKKKKNKEKETIQIIKNVSIPIETQKENQKDNKTDNKTDNNVLAIPQKIDKIVIPKKTMEGYQKLSDVIDVNNEFLRGFEIYKYLRDTNDKRILIIQNPKKLKEKYILKIKSEISKYEYNVYKILTTKNHPNIQTILVMWIVNGKYFSLCEYIEGDDLYEYMDKYGGFTEKQLKNITRQIICGLEFLHENNIAHADLKCENVIYNSINETVKIIDFDLSVIINEKYKDVYIDKLFGTPMYISHESKKLGIYSSLTDIWQFGVLLYLIITNTYPCEHILEHTCTDECKFNMLYILKDSIMFRKYDISIYDLVKGMLEYDGQYRLNLIGILESEWINMQ